MRRVRIATDSTADIPPDLASELEIAIVPCQILWGQEVYLDGVDLPPLEFYGKLAQSSELPRTSQPQMKQFLDTYRRLLEVEEGEAVVSIHVAGNLSGTLNAAWAAAQMLPESCSVEVIDSGQVSMGMGWVVIEAARLAQRGASQAEVGQAVRGMLPRLRASAMIDTLDNLYKGGRISQVTAALGTALQIKPLINIQDGNVEIVARVRTRSRALKRLEALVRGWGRLAEVMVLHAGPQKQAELLAGLLQDLVPDRRVMVGPAGSALVTHLGLGAVGVCGLVAAEAGGEVT